MLFRSIDDIPDNSIGERNLEQNWGNTIVIKHMEFFYSKLSHLKTNTIEVKVGEKIKQGDLLAKCGNSGNSPYPHLHFQLQATPHIGSRTIDYPISNFLIRKDQRLELKTVALPEKGNLVMNIQVNSSLRKAFHFTPGEKFRFKLLEPKEQMVEWEVKLDYYLNKYIECDKSKARAFFRVDDSMLYFTHFEGDRKSLLYHFYLAAYKVCFGYYKELSITDTFPSNMVFSTPKLAIHDFTAPFTQYMTGKYSLAYLGAEDPLADTHIILQSQITTFFFRKELRKIDGSISVDRVGIREIKFELGDKKYVAVRLENFN